MKRAIPVLAILVGGIVAACTAGVVGEKGDTEAEPRQALGAKSKCDGGDLFSWKYCNANCLCSEGEGDCDKDAHCEGELVCQRNVGEHFGVDRRMDICLPEDWEPGGECVNGFCGTPACKSGEQLCDKKCVNVSNDRNNCGGCGLACPEGTICGGNGTCKACTDDLQVCGNACVDTESDTNNCGDCGQICPSSTICSEAFCQACAGGEQACGGACVDVATDEANCGGCGLACPAGESCDGGLCVPACEGGNCGMPCSADSHCAAGETCSDGNCYATCKDDADCSAGEYCDENKLCQVQQSGGGCGCGGGSTTTDIPCAADSECDDGLTCSTDACKNGICEHKFCDVGEFCKFEADGTTSCAPQGGGSILVACNADADCDDNDNCTKDECKDGTCSHADICSGGGCGGGGG